MPYPSDIPWESESNGQRLAALRKRRRWTQRVLADRAGYSLAAVRAFEQGRRSLDQGSTILTFSRALDCHPTEITGQPLAPRDDASQDAAVAVAAVRRALLRHGRPARPDDEEVTRIDIAELSERVGHANALRASASLVGTAEVLPALLRDLQVACDVLDGDERRTACGLLAGGYECAMQYLYKMGHSAAATLATERVVQAADATEDPLRMTAARWYEAGEFLSIGEHHDAADIIDQSLKDLGHPRSPQQVSLQGAFHLKAALNAARATDHGTAERHMAKAKAAADALGEDRNDFQLQFGPTNAAIWSVSLPVEMGRGRDAVRAAEHVTRSLPADFSPERRSHHFIDIGRGHWYNGQRDDALASFLEAESIAPTATRMNAGVRETVRTMIRQQRRSQLVELGMRVGAL
ncbi:transcriptional regulator with XRE-family HTH domain [Streptomyces sp. Amel2xB2]|uniref:helix-turn-helix domain-containing protein n=1 Tax=Streptomyces sp. Amel2xB2 TaxID=1305829 RepID=UPI000DB9F585|nr:helix-turn-helix transcriptional regulator [Streptomyces sp. Amel2xB2]RAJ66621.1 transcriptional regulator with XRE-family HTH domain [Streptomyces sp. Amel2xB2]